VAGLLLVVGVMVVVLQHPTGLILPLLPVPLLLLVVVVVLLLVVVAAAAAQHPYLPPLQRRVGGQQQPLPPLPLRP
jgi:hypothetical protein